MERKFWDFAVLVPKIDIADELQSAKGDADSRLEQIREYVGMIDDAEILRSKLPSSRKYYYLGIKHGASYRNEQLCRKSPVFVHILSVRKNAIRITGYCYHKQYHPEATLSMVHSDGTQIHLQLIEENRFDKRDRDGEAYLKACVFDAVIPLSAVGEWRFEVSVGAMTEKVPIRYGRYSRLQNVKGSYFLHRNYIVKKIGNCIGVARRTVREQIVMSRRYHRTLEENGVAHLIPLRKNAVRLRKRHRPIWIITDKPHRGGDNGEALFRYLMQSDVRKTHEIFFAVDRSSPDYDRIRAIGPTLDITSDEYRAYFLAASKIISSAGDAWVTNAFGEELKWVLDLIRFDYVFLQHGIIKDDLPNWLHRYNKNIQMFVTSTQPEYDSIVDGSYGYDESVVQLTGLPRFDRLHDEHRRLVAIMPTWRKMLVPEPLPGQAVRPYEETFKESSYCVFYNELINDSRLLQAMNQAGYTGVFLIHPSFAAQRSDFHGNDTIRVVTDAEMTYADAFASAALMVTDYSSVAMDFAYLKKPIVYYQGDRKAFFAGHSYTEGYFDYERDGFGPIVYSKEELIDEMIKTLGRGCTVTEMYAKRVDDFFAYTDRDNCKRVTQAILDIDR